jgi:hypothetical protein
MTMSSKLKALIIVFVILLPGLAGCGARAAEDPDVLIAQQACARATDALAHYQCLESHALTSRNPAVCRLTGSELEGRCLQNLYQKSQDPSLCSRIYLEETRLACQAYYAGPGSKPSPTPTPQPAATPFPTPQPTPTPLGDLPIEQVLPAQVTPPPPSWHPATPDGSPERDPVAWLRAHGRLLTDLLNSSSEVEQALQRYALLIPGQAGRTETPAALWSVIAELDQDGAYEWLISAPRLDRPCLDTECYTYLFIFRYQEGLFIPAGVIPAANWLEGLANPRFVSVEDLDADGNNEVVLSTQSGEETQVLVGRWQNGRWQSLSADPLSYPNAEVRLEDINGDSLIEILLHGGLVQDPQAGLQRPQTRVYALHYRRYVLETTLGDADPHPYYRMLDARRALEERDTETALELAEDVFNEKNYATYDQVNSYAEARIVPYAGALAMLARMQLEQPGAVAELMIAIEQRYGESGSPFVEGARAAWQAYRRTQDPLSACRALEETVTLQAAKAPFFEVYGTRTERITTWDICPWDEKPRQGTPPNL